MYGVRFRDIDGHTYQLAVAGGVFVEPGEMVDDWIDVRGGYSVGGLVDAHAHLTGASVETMARGMSDVDGVLRVSARQQIDGGVLLVADKGTREDSPYTVDGIAEEDRPIIVKAGAMVTVEHGYYPDFGVLVDPESDPDSWIETVAGPGISWLKLVGDWPRMGKGPMRNFTLPQLTRIVTAAHDRDLRVAIHAAAPETPGDAVAAGVDSIEHGLFMTEDDLQALGSRGGAWVPTVAAMEGIRDLLGPESSGGRLMASGLDNVRQLISAAPGMGVNVLAGTDLHLPHGDVHKEVGRLVAYGLELVDAVHAVTDGGYNYLGVRQGFSIGERADIVSLRGDPREDVSVLADPTLIIRAGRVITAPN